MQTVGEDEEGVELPLPDLVREGIQSGEDGRNAD